MVPIKNRRICFHFKLILTLIFPVLIAVQSKLEPKPREDGNKNANLKNYEFRSLLVTP